MSLGVGIATGLYGISFGALAVAAGLEIWQAQLLSILMFSGGSQFAFIGVIATDEMGEVMAIRHKTLDIRGVQFHPESILTLEGKKLLHNFLKFSV